MPPKDPPESTEPQLPRGASPAELDRIRASIRSSPRSRPLADALEQVPTPERPIAPVSPVSTPVAATAARIAMVPKAELDRVIEEGRSLLEVDPKGAHALFERAYRRNTTDARALSNYGLTLVLVEGDRQRGIRFCEEAVRRGARGTEALVNLAKALVLTRNKEQAVRALRRAQELAPDDPRVGQEFILLGLRRKPPIPWLPRSFVLNKWIGMLTWRFSHKRKLNPFGF